MGSTRQKGKIPHNEWPKILAMYNGGETIASIGRAYGCTAPAIRYIVKRSGALKGARGRTPMAELPGHSRQHAIKPVAADGSVPFAVGRFGPKVGTPILGAELRKRISGDIASFLVALDQVFLDGSIGSVAALQEATDRLMRSTARTRLELERAVRAYENDGLPADLRENAAS